MLSLYDVFAEDFTSTVIVFLLLLVIIAFIAAKRKSVSVAIGLFLVILSLVTSPFVYLKKAVLTLADDTRRSKAGPGDTPHYLLTKLVTAMQAVLLVLAVALLATGFVSSWNQLMPSRQLRDTIGSTEEGLTNLRKELKELEPAVSTMERTWSSRRDSLAAAYEAARSNRPEMMVAQNNDLAERINAFGDTAQQTLSEIKSYHGMNEYLAEPGQYEPIYKEITSHLQQQNLSHDLAALLTKYNENWYAQMLSRFDARSLAGDQLQCALYPEYYSRRQRLETVKALIPAQEKDLEQMRGEVRYNGEAFVLQIVLTFVEFIFFVWLIGLLIEWIGLGVEMASDIRKIRESSVK